MQVVLVAGFELGHLLQLRLVVDDSWVLEAGAGCLEVEVLRHDPWSFASDVFLLQNVEHIFDLAMFQQVSEGSLRPHASDAGRIVTAAQDAEVDKLFLRHGKLLQNSRVVDLHDRMVLVGKATNHQSSAMREAVHIVTCNCVS